MKAIVLRTFFVYKDAECGGNLTDGCTEKFGYVYEMPYMDELTGGRGITFATGTPYRTV